MILDSILSGKRNLFWFGFHILLGFVSTVTSIALIVWFYTVLFTSLNKSIINLRKGRPFYYISQITYLVGFEMLGRMTKAYPFIPIELSKYFIIIFSLLGLVIIQKRNLFWFVLVILSFFLLIVDQSGQRVYFDIINNYFGFLAVCLLLSLLLTQKFINFPIHLILKLLLYAIIPSLFFSFIKTPDIDDIQFRLNANFETSGGAATNQVATVFGLGLMICFYFWYKKIEFSGYRNLDLMLGISFLAQGLLTFSRGGLVVAILGIVLFIVLYAKKINFRLVYLALITLLLVIFTFNYIDNLTGGKLLLRYQGETEGTYNYGAEKDLKKITSGRSLIFEEDLKLWFSHPILGVGVGSSRYLRGGTDEKVSAHIELSRLLAEQGLLGLVYFLALINIGIRLRKLSILDKSKIIYFVLFVVGFLTTFHAAMRTFVTPLLIGLSVIGLKSVTLKKNEKLIHRSY
jgi:hypothetical protein